MSRRFEILLFLCWYAVTRPSWAFYWIQVVIGGRSVRLHPFHPDPARVCSVAAATERLFPDCGAAAPNAATFDPTASSHHAVPRSFDGSAALLSLLGAVIDALRPAETVEVGVARGATSRAILERLAGQRHGMLHSIEFPVPRFGYRAAVGSLVPPGLRDRWELVIGPSQVELPPLLRRIGQVDLFLHDAAHNYWAQREAIDSALPHLRPGGVLIMDDLFSSAFVDGCAAHCLDYLLVEQPGKDGLIGVLRTPPARQ